MLDKEQKKLNRKIMWETIFIIIGSIVALGIFATLLFLGLKQW